MGYQWQFEGANLDGATDSAYVIGAVEPANAGNYTVIVTNVAGAVTSSVASLTVWVLPSITTQPQSRTNLLGAQVEFAVAATGTAPLGYQWQWNGTDIAGATSASYQICGVQPSHAGDYRVVVTNVAGALTSAVASLTVLVPPSVRLQPQSVAAILGSNATFAIEATGTAPLSYLWQRGGVPIPGATESSYTLSNVNLSDDGAQFSCVVSNSAGTAASQSGILTVLVPPTIAVQPVSVTTNQGSAVTLKVTASGTAPLSYQWRLSGTNLADNTDAELFLTNVQPAQAGPYCVVVTNLAGAITSSVASLTVLLPPTIVSQPQSLAMAPGSSATFAVEAAGTTPLSYLWQRGGAPIAGATEASYTLSNVSVSDDGAQFSCVASNSAGVLTSLVATLTVTNPAVTPSIVVQPAGITNYAGATISLTVTATGTAPLSYQWRHFETNLVNDSRVSGVTTSTLRIENATINDAGTYSVWVSNPVGSTRSLNATVSILTRTLRIDAAAGGPQLKNGAFAFRVTGFSKHGPVVIYGSSNLVHWESIFTNPPLEGALEFSDTTVTNRALRFYRAEER